MDGMQRLEYVDIFRGIALLIMVTIQIFDFLSVSSIYTTPPYYVDTINSVTWVPPSLLFTFVSGMSVFLLVKKRLFVNKLSGQRTFFEVFKRYGKYVLISLPFTTIMWNVGVYFGWNEAIQGIGLTAIFTAVFLIMFFKYFKKVNSTIGYTTLTFLIIIFSFLQSTVPKLLDNSTFASDFPRQPNLSYLNIPSLFGSLVLNIFFRGWFSIANLFPMMLGGVILINLIHEDKSSHKKLMVISVAPLLLSVLLHLLGYNIDYYGRSFSLTFFSIGESALICFVTLFLYKKSTKESLFRIWNIITTFGITAFFVYITHYLLILKMLEITALKDLLPDIYSWIITIPLVVSVYFLAKYYLKIKSNLPSFLRL
ncbi:MAG TPA: hypothetical protein VJH34_00180 [archaeon]|nr:hypothetical protein [archaeon]